LSFDLSKLSFKMGNQEETKKNEENLTKEQLSDYKKLTKDFCIHFFLIFQSDFFRHQRIVRFTF
jgi:SUMO ligase MMS21 Smc5/6 complex component